MKNYLFMVDLDTDGIMPVEYKIKIQDDSIILTLIDANIQVIVAVKDIEKVLNGNKQRKKV